jgi:Ca2+-binding RTX toxin-like protein
MRVKFFSELIQGKSLTDTQIKSIKNERYQHEIVLDEKLIQLEMSDEDVLVSGFIKWSDAFGNFHPLAGATVKVWDDDLIGGDEEITTVRTDERGFYQATFDNDDGIGAGNRDVYIEVFADGPLHYVEGPGSYYSIKSDIIQEIRSGDNTIGLMIGNSITSERVFSISNSLYFGGLFAEAIRELETPKIKVNYPVYIDDGDDSNDIGFPARFVANEVLNETRIEVDEQYPWAPDVILHEYGHYLSYLDNLDKSPGGKHTRGKSNIPELGKELGVQLAWGEGLANYLAVAAQHIVQDFTTLPDVSSLGNTKYENPSIAQIEDPPFFDLEEIQSNLPTIPEESRGEGEGDEMPISRILWDIADMNNEPFNIYAEEFPLFPKDEISIGHKELYSILKEIPDLDRLNDLWNYLTNNLDKLNLPENLSNYAKKVKLGVIFQEHGVSPSLSATDGMLNRVLGKKWDEDTPPTFRWESRSDLFQVYIFDEDFMTPVIQEGNIDVRFWQPSTNDWQEIENNPGIYHLVVAGSDIYDEEGNEYPEDRKTGPYWSGAGAFSVGVDFPAYVNSSTLNNFSENLEQLTQYQETFNSLLSGDGLPNNDSLSGIPFFNNLLAPGSVAAASAPAIASSEVSSAQFALASSEPISTASDSTVVSAIDDATQFITKIKNELQSVLDSLGDSTVNEIQQALFQALGPDGPFEGGILQSPDDVQIEVGEGQAIKFNLAISGSTEFETPPLPSEIGLPWLGLDLKEDASAGVELNYTFNLGFGINGDGEFYIDTSDPKDLSVALIPILPAAEATLGLFQVTVDTIDDDDEVESKIEFVIDVSDGNDDQLTATDTPNFSPSGSAQLDLNIATGLDDLDNDLLALLPQITTDFYLNWEFTEDGGAPEIGFTDVALDLSSFAEKFLGPVFQGIQDVTEPLDPIVEILSEDLPIIEASLIDLAQRIDLGFFDEETAEFVEQVLAISQGILAIEEFGDAKIDLGSFDLDTDVRESIENLSGVAPNPTRDPGTLESQPLANDFFGGLSNFENEAGEDVAFLFEFPFLNEGDLLDTGVSLVQLLLGNSSENIEFFAYQTPNLGFNFSIDGFLPPIPIFGPIVLKFGGGVGAGAQVRFGFDTQGLVQFADSDFAQPELIGNGFFVSNPDESAGEEGSVVSLAGVLTAEAAADAVIAEIAAGGGIGLSVGLGIGGEDGKIRAEDIVNTPPLCLFDPSGALSAIIYASFEVDLGFFSFTKRFDLADINLIDFTLDTGCESDLDTFFDVENPKVDPESELAQTLMAQGIIDRVGTDAGDIITVSQDDDGITVEGFEEDPGPFPDVKLIALKTKESNDEITFAANVQVGSQIEGGVGNDTIVAGQGVDFLTGGQGDDSLDGGAGDAPNTAVYADAPEPGNPKEFAVVVDLVNGNAEKDGHGTQDTLENIQNVEGSRYRDKLIGNGQKNVLDSGDGDDELSGGDGDDVLLAGNGADTVDGGAGRDTMTYIGSKAPVQVNLSSQDLPANLTGPLGSATSGTSISLRANQGRGGEAEGDTVTNVENAHGSIFDDLLVASDLGGQIAGDRGNDIIFAGPGADTLDGDSDLPGPKGVDWLSYRLSNEGVAVNLKTSSASGGYAQGDVIKPALNDEGNAIEHLSSFEHLEGSNTDARDELFGDRDHNIIKGLNGDDQLSGDDGDDTLVGGAGADNLDGGDGLDWADYRESPSGVTVNLATSEGFGGHAQGDTFTTIENLRGTDLADSLTGDKAANWFKPELGDNDWVDGNEGSDDQETSNAIIDRLIVDYSRKDTGTGIVGGITQGELEQGTFERTRGDGSTDQVTFSNIEAIKLIGTIHDDEIYGGKGDDVLLAGAGDDTIYGGFGSNTILADDGDDVVVDQSDLNRQLAGIPNPPNSKSDTPGKAGGLMNVTAQRAGALPGDSGAVPRTGRSYPSYLALVYSVSPLPVRSQPWIRHSLLPKRIHR